MAQFIDANCGGKNLHFEGYIYTKIRDGGITLNEYTTVIKHLIGL